jgi:hypothetical protein
MKTWAHEEMLTLDLGDQRLNKRCIAMLDALASAPEASFPTAMSSAAAVKATYRFLKNEHFQTDAIADAHREMTYQRCQNFPHVLALQDTASFNYSGHPQTTGLGYLDDHLCQGFFVHSLLMCSPTGVPLGLGYQDVWARSAADYGKRARRKQKPIEQKESFKWLKALHALEKTFPESTEVTVISDQESDIFEYFFLARPPHIHLLLRARYNRPTLEGALKTRLRQLPAAGEFEVKLQRKDSQAARTARLAVRFAPFQVLPPKNHPLKKQLGPVRLYAVLAEEVSEPPEGVERISWMLLTTRPVTCFEAARACVEMYSYRWLIERYHYVLKSGCQLEALQLSSRERLERALVLYGIAAWRLLWMTYLARTEPQASCEEAFEAYEWQALHGYLYPHNPLPKKPPAIHLVVRWIAQLGGFLNRKGDGEPGVKTIWKGLTKLEMISQTWLRLQQNPHLLKVSGRYG